MNYVSALSPWSTSKSKMKNLLIPFWSEGQSDERSLRSNCERLWQAAAGSHPVLKLAAWPSAKWPWRGWKWRNLVSHGKPRRNREKATQYPNLKSSIYIYIYTVYVYVYIYIICTYLYCIYTYCLDTAFYSPISIDRKYDISYDYIGVSQYFYKFTFTRIHNL